MRIKQLSQLKWQSSDRAIYSITQKFTTNPPLLLFPSHIDIKGIRGVVVCSSVVFLISLFNLLLYISHSFPNPSDCSPPHSNHSKLYIWKNNILYIYLHVNNIIPNSLSCPPSKKKTPLKHMHRCKKCH